MAPISAGRDIICSHCWASIKDDDIDISNKENEEGEEYFELMMTCQNCNSDYEQTGWGHIDDIRDDFYFYPEPGALSCKRYY